MTDIEIKADEAADEFVRKWKAKPNGDQTTDAVLAFLRHAFRAGWCKGYVDGGKDAMAAISERN